MKVLILVQQYPGGSKYSDGGYYIELQREVESNNRMAVESL